MSTNETLIRKYQTRDYSKCHEIIEKSAIIMDGVNEEGIQFILARNTPTYLNTMHTVVCENPTVGIVGLGALDNNEIKSVYVLPQAQRKGIGSIIMSSLENTARKKGLSIIVLEAQPNAVPFYSKLGCESIEEGFTNRDKAEFYFTKMKKVLK